MKKPRDPEKNWHCMGKCREKWYIFLNSLDLCRVAWELNRNLKLQPSEPFSQEPNTEPELPEPFLKNEINGMETQ